MDVDLHPQSESRTADIRKTAAGLVRGVCDSGVCRFLSVPYAAPPIGEQRFREPQPVPAWDGIRDATVAGPCAPQVTPQFPGLDIEPLVGSGGLEGGDYLSLNIWTPADGVDCPVMVFVHGGAFVVGSKDASIHDGMAFARSGVTVVGINYRLGLDGFLPIPGVPTNLGLRDMIFALQWVRDNIAAFGGDPGNVTLFGESAGAMAIADLVTSPLAKGLFKRAIIQSGHGAMVRDLPVARRLVDKVARILKVSPDRAGFAKIDNSTGWSAVEKANKPTTRLNLRDGDGREPVFGISRFIPVWGDDVLPKKPLDALKAGAGREIDVLIGTNAEEMNFYFVPLKVRAKQLPGFLFGWMLGKSHPRATETLRAYGLGDKARRSGHVFTDTMTDLVFRWPARRYAEEHQGRTWLYEFEWKSNAFDGEFGATHGMELPFVFKTLDKVTGPGRMIASDPPQKLADRMHQTWVRFATDGTLPWLQFKRESRKVHMLAADETVSEPPMPAAPFLP